MINKLIKRSYQSIVNRGLITDLTNIEDFSLKIQEEFEELKFEYLEIILKDKPIPNENFIEESVDLVNVILNMLHHYGIDFEKEFVKCIEKNERRSKYEIRNNLFSK